MPRKRITIFLVTCVMASGLLTAAARAPSSSKENVLHRFTGMGGANPVVGLVSDPAGNLYGTTAGGGVTGVGTAFELMPAANGTWTYKVLRSFNGPDGGGPWGSLVLDATGNLYGTTRNGGTRSGCGGYGCGDVFELMPGADGKWTENVLHDFNGSDGAWPQTGLIFDPAGNLYGTASSGGGHGHGTVFELMPGSNGKWTAKVLYAFQSNGTDGGAPLAGVIFDASGNLYGTTSEGGIRYNGCGARGCGTVFELTPGANGIWTEMILSSFQANGRGRNPAGGVIFDAAGNLYGTTYAPTANVFELMPGSGGTWTEKVLYEVGGYPSGGLVFDGAGNLYGTTGAFGTAFELQPGANGQWTERILHTFKDNSRTGSDPQSDLILDSAGNLYGTTYEGGNLNDCQGNGCGVVFELTP
jgi:uncharacterized repeat protein (TIGR03803 family)